MRIHRTEPVDRAALFDFSRKYPSHNSLLFTPLFTPKFENHLNSEVQSIQFRRPFTTDIR